jgi:hypothetical protein
MGKWTGHNYRQPPEYGLNFLITIANIVFKILDFPSVMRKIACAGKKYF